MEPVRVAAAILFVLAGCSTTPESELRRNPDSTIAPIVGLETTARVCSSSSGCVDPNCVCPNTPDQRPVKSEDRNCWRCLPN